MEEIIENSSYYNFQQERSRSESQLISSNKGTQRPMDRLMVNVNDEENINTQNTPAMKKLRNKVCLNIFRLFMKKAYHSMLLEVCHRSICFDQLGVMDEDYNFQSYI